MQLFKISFNRVNVSRIMSFYAVANGREIGVYNNWAQCEPQVKGFKGAKYKKFPTRLAAEEFINKHKAADKETLYKPESIVVPLGNKIKQNEVKVEKDTNDWPPCDGDEDITDEDLLMALAEVEGLHQTSKNYKRKTESTSDCSSSSKIKKKYESIIWEPVALKHIGNMEFLLDSEGYVIVYTDGSCFNNGQENACAGYGVYFGENHVLNAGKPVIGRVTNNVGEIQAAIYAIKTAKSLGISKLCISTDSQFLINSVTLWIKGWKAKNWRLKNGGPVKNATDFKELDALLQDNSVTVKWNYVEAHRGIKGNEMADKLAREGSEIFRSIHLK